jgi:hypothetical protein
MRRFDSDPRLHYFNHLEQQRKNWLRFGIADVLFKWIMRGAPCAPTISPPSDQGRSATVDIVHLLSEYVGAVFGVSGYNF